MKKILALEKILFYIFVFSIPFQARLVLAQWVLPFNEWTSGFLWGTDLLLGALLVLWFARAIYEKMVPHLSLIDIIILLFFLVTILSSFHARIPAISWYRLLKLAEYLGLYFYIKSGKNKIFQQDMLYAVVFLSGILQALIGIVQSWLQSNIGLKLLGESVLHVGNQGIAVFEVGTKLFLRAYGITPHPNILATWLFLSLWSFYVLFTTRESKKHRGFLFVGYAVILYAFFLTFSRIPIGLWFLGGIAALVILFFQYKREKNIEAGTGRVRAIVVATLAIIIVFTVAYFPHVRARAVVTADDEAVTQRIFYNDIALKVTGGHRWFGIGIGQFTSELMRRIPHYPAYIYQPAHNIYLLISSELGIPGALLFIVFLFLLAWKQRRRFWAQWPALLVAGTFVVIGLADHMFWTLQQGSFIWWGLFALL